MATLEELEQRVADLEQYVEEQATHTLAYSAEQVDAFFATVDARVLSGGRKTVVLTNEARLKNVALSAEDLGVTNVTSDIKVVFTVHAPDYTIGDDYHYAFTTAVLGPVGSPAKLYLRFSDVMYNPYGSSDFHTKIPAGTYYLDWLRIG